jgi:hypothetical protein
MFRSRNSCCASTHRVPLLKGGKKLLAVSRLPCMVVALGALWGYFEVAVIVLAHSGKNLLHHMTLKAGDASFCSHTQNRPVFKYAKFWVQGINLREVSCRSCEA